MAPRRPLAAVASAVVALALLAGCTQEPTKLEQGSVEQKVSRAVADLIAPPISDVRCPVDIPIGTGVEIECDVVLAEPSGTLPVKVVQRDTEGNLDVVQLLPILSARQVADQLRLALNDTFDRSFQVDCGKEASKVREPGQQLLCRARDKMSRRQVVVTIVDERGSLTFEVIDG